MKKTAKILNIIFALNIGLFLLDLLPNFDIKNQFIKSFVYLFSTFGSILIISINFQQKLNKLTLILPTIGILGILFLGPLRILNAKSAWKTQTIIYQNGHLANKTIEYQLQDVGARGYNKREVETFYLTNFFILVAEVPKDIEKRIEWTKVNKDVNELKLKY